MKYRLKKDLPFAFAGTTIEADSVGLFVRYRTKNFLTWYIGENDSLQNLINSDWIEEIKPREFYIEIRKSDGVATDVYELIDASHNSLNMIERYDYIKVREVVE